MLFIGQVQGSRPEHSVPALVLELHVYQLSPWLFHASSLGHLKIQRWWQVPLPCIVSSAIIASTGSAPSIRQFSGPCPLSLGTFKTIAPKLQSGLLAHQCGDIMLPQVGLKPCQMKKMATHSSILTGKFHGQRRLEVYSPWGGKMKKGHSLKQKQKQKLPWWSSG